MCNQYHPRGISAPGVICFWLLVALTFIEVFSMNLIEVACLGGLFSWDQLALSKYVDLTLLVLLTFALVMIYYRMLYCIYCEMVEIYSTIAPISWDLGGMTVTEKDLKKLNRYQLLELLIVQTSRADKLQARLEEVEKQLNEKDLKMTSLGSIAEASLQLGGVFQAAQAAADLYIAEAKKKAEEIEEAAHKKAAEILFQAQVQARRIKGE